MIVTLSERRLTARKAHACNACLGTIAPGQRYVRQRNVDGADAWTWKAHDLCTLVTYDIAQEFALDEDDSVDVFEVRARVESILAALFAVPQAA